MASWLKGSAYNRGGYNWLVTPVIKRLEGHYGIAQDGRLDGPSQTIMALQNEINQYVG